MRALLLLSFALLAVPAAARTVVVEEVHARHETTLARPAVEVDATERARVATGAVPGDGTRLVADADGWIQSDELVGGYATARVEVDADGAWILEGMGYAGVFVNGEPRIGNVYGYTDDWEPWQPAFDFSLVPVHLRAGANELLFFGNRYGVMRARLRPAGPPLELNSRDVTLPDLVALQAIDAPAAIVVLNPTNDVVDDARIVAQLDGAPPVEAAVGALAPWSLRKVPFAVRGPASEGPTRVLRVQVQRGRRTLDEAVLELAVKAADENRRVTFTSRLDGSVQYYGYLPASGSPGPKALVLSLHGAAVEAINQSGSYAPLPWAELVAPTNRRPFGFSWEDIGRLDALEVLDLAQERLATDPDRVYLTGHSMGGHGSWHLSTLYPDRFAAVGPSAGWISLWSYRMDPPADPPTPLVALVERATLPSRTLEMAPNLAPLGVYVLHGTADDNVPVAQAHLMLDRLGEFHHDFVFHGEPGAGHWWDRSDDPGADCVTWVPMFDFFVHHRRPAPDEVRGVHFRTPAPSVSASDEWAHVLDQPVPFTMSTIDLERDPAGGVVRGTTNNVSALALDFALARTDSVRVELDGDVVLASRPVGGSLRLARDDHWALAGPADRARKGPQRYGTFREVFARRVQFVYATGGTAQENARALARARYDAEILWYRGNASVDVIADTAFDPGAEPDRNVVLYGNADTHEDWFALWRGPVDVRRGRVSAARHSLVGDGFGVLAVYPRPGSDVAVVGIAAATGPEGARLLERRPVLTPGVAYPDLTVFGLGEGASTVVGAGFFGPDWSVERGEFQWADPR